MATFWRVRSFASISTAWHVYYDFKHPYDKDMVEFFAYIVQHGGESTYNIVRGSMGSWNKQNLSKESRINLGGLKC